MRPQQTPVTCNTVFTVIFCHLPTDSAAPSYFLLFPNYVQNLKPRFFAKVFLDTINVETLLLFNGVGNFMQVLEVIGI